MRAALALVAALAAIAGADPKPQKRPPPEPKPEHEEGRSKRAQAVDYEPKTAPKRKVGTKTLVLAEVAISGRIQKPLAATVLSAPSRPRLEPPRELPPAVLAAVDIVLAADDFGAARARQLGRYAKGRSLPSTAVWQTAEAALDARAGAELRAFLSGDGVKGRGAASAAIALLFVALDEQPDEATLAAGGPMPIDAAAATAERVLAHTTGAEQRALAFALLAFHGSPDAALALMCGTASATPPADLSGCKADALDAGQALYGWIELGDRLYGSPLAVEAFQRAAALARGDQLPVVERDLADALRDQHRNDEAVRVYVAMHAHARASGNTELVEAAEAYLPRTVTTPNGPADDPDADGLVSAATAIARVSATFGNDPARAVVLAQASFVYSEALDRAGAAALLAAALDANPQSAEAPEWRAQQLALAVAVAPASDEQAVAQAIRQAREPLVRCLREQRLGSAKARVELAVGGNGQVVDATVSGIDGRPATCVQTIAKRWVLAPGEPRTLVVPVYLEEPG